MSDAWCWLDAELARLWRLAGRRWRALQAAQLRPQPGHPATAELEAQLALRAHEAPADEEALARLRERTPLALLVDRLGLGELERDVLLWTVAPQLDAALGELLAALRGTGTRRAPDLTLIGQLGDHDRVARLRLADTVDEGAPLVRWRLLRLSADGVDASAPPIARALLPSPDLLHRLRGGEGLPPSLRGVARLIAGEATLDDLCLEPPLRRALDGLDRLLAAPPAHRPWLLLHGAVGAGKSTIATRLAAQASLPTLLFDPRRFDAAALPEALRAAGREALIAGAVLYVGPIEPARERGLLAERGRELDAQLGEYPGPLVLGVEAAEAPVLRTTRVLHEVALPMPSEPARRRLWQRALPDAARGRGLDLDALARSYHLTPGEIGHCANEAHFTASARGRLVAHDDLRTAIDRCLRNELGELARRFVVTASWDDLVLAPEERARVDEFISRKLNADRVYREWRLGARTSYGQGLIALFSGEPGTGKTLLAGLIANKLGLDIYQVDLSQLFSKWVGETEKQLSRLFDYAERANAVLLFDEADALFAKRTEVDSSNDRYANLAVNHLLQRLERYCGVGILTTNKEAALDPALARRLSLQLRFALPAPCERERLWRSLLLPTMPLGRDVDVAELARRYELAGGDIRNIVLRAAFVAAGRGAAIDMATLRHSVALELEDRGRVVQRLDGEAPADEPAVAPPVAVTEGADTTYCESTHDFIDG